MNNYEKYKQAFIDAFAIDATAVESAAYQSTSAWDSVGHMGLISAIEEAFDIAFDTDDIVDLSSFDKGIEILAKYDVVIEK